MEGIVDIIARVSESSYRRGYQQGVMFANQGKVTVNQACAFRFDKRLCLSPPHNPKGYKCSPLERLEIEAKCGMTMLTYEQNAILLTMIAGE